MVNKQKKLSRLLDFSSDKELALFELLDEIDQNVDDVNKKFGNVDINSLTKLKGEKGDKGDKGDRGADGRDGKDGRDGRDGLDGFTPIKGVDYFDGKDGKDGVDGKNATEIDMQQMIVDTVNYIESLEGDERIDAKAIKNLPTTREIVREVAGGFIETPIKAGSNTTVTKDAFGAWVISSTGGGGSGDVSKVGTPVNNQVSVWTGDGTIEGDSALTFDTTTDTLRVGGIVKTPKVQADSSAGLLIEASNGTDIGDLGAGNTANVTWYGSHNFDTATQDTIAAFTGAGKTLASLATATYPSLTELSYVKGVTSAIQTQLNAKVSDGAITGGELTMSTNRLLGRTTASTGAIEEISIGSGLSLSAGTLTATGGGGGSNAYAWFIS